MLASMKAKLKKFKTIIRAGRGQGGESAGSSAGIPRGDNTASKVSAVEGSTNSNTSGPNEQPDVETGRGAVVSDDSTKESERVADYHREMWATARTRVLVPALRAYRHAHATWESRKANVAMAVESLKPTENALRDNDHVIDIVADMVSPGHRATVVQEAKDAAEGLQLISNMEGAVNQPVNMQPTEGVSQMKAAEICLFVEKCRTRAKRHADELSQIAAPTATPATNARAKRAKREEPATKCKTAESEKSNTLSGETRGEHTAGTGAPRLSRRHPHWPDRLISEQ